MKKNILFFLIVILLFSQFTLAQTPRGKNKTYIVTQNKPVSFRIYTPAKITMSLNYTQKGCNYTSYYIYQNDKLIYTTKQGKNYIPPKTDTSIIENGFYGFKVGNNIINNKLCQGQRNRSNAQLRINLQCLNGDCFMDPMILEMQRMQEQQRQEMERLNQQRMLESNMNNINNINNPNSIMQNPFMNNMMGF